MIIRKNFKPLILIVVIITLIFISPLIFNALSPQLPNTESTDSIYNVAMAETVEENIWKLCQEQDFSYELLLSIYHAEGIENIGIQSVKKDLAELDHLRDYWAQEGYSEEDVFNLMLLSWELGIEGCKSIILENPNYNEIEYLREVSEYKYYLEQNLYAR